MNSNGWQKEKLANLCKKIGSGATPRGGKETYSDLGEFALIRSQNVLDYSFSYDGLAYINNEQAGQLRNVEVVADDVLLNITGDSVARVCQVPEDVLPARVNQHVAILRPNENKLRPAYLKYFLLNPEFKSYMLGLSACGGTRNALTKGMIEDFEIVFPSIPMQDKICDILSALDEKIENNRKINKTLEAMGRTYFKEWFIEFNFPGATGEMVESKLGMIPHEWTIQSIGSLFDFVIGGDWGKDDAQDDYPVFCSVVRGTDLADVLLGHIEAVPQRYIKNASVEKRRLCAGDIVFEISGGSKEQATGRNLLFTDELIDLFGKQVIPASFCRLIRCENIGKAVFLGTFLNMFYSDGGTWEFQLQSTGISNFQFNHFASSKLIAIPTDQQIEMFRELVWPFYQAVGINAKQIQSLTQLRNKLLPKLMSGEIAV